MPTNINRPSIKKCGHKHINYDTAKACAARLAPVWGEDHTPFIASCNDNPTPKPVAPDGGYIM
jgi:hypothetical protein